MSGRSPARCFCTDWCGDQRPCRVRRRWPWDSWCGGDLLGLDLGDRLGGAEERLGGGHVAGFAQVNINQITVAVDCLLKVAPRAGDLEVRFIDVPAPLPARHLRRPSASS